MSKTTDWLPAPRQEQLNMAVNWCAYLMPKAASFTIPTQTITSLAQLATAAHDALGAAMDETTRTPVANAACRTAFKTLTAAMRSFKKHYILIPPMSEADFTALGVRIPDTHRTPSEAPSAQVRADPFLAGPHQMGIRIVYVIGDPGGKANKGYRIYYVIVPPGGAAPMNPEQFTQSFYTMRKKDVLDLPFSSSGSTIYFCVQVENEGKKGPWGPITSAIIP
jgi:hypothetical protein